MAIAYPEETEAGFTVQEWESPKGGVVVLRVEQDEQGNEILVNGEGRIAKFNEQGDVIGFE